MVKRSLSSTSPVPPAMASIDYSSWTKEQLIAKINQLESSTTTTTEPAPPTKKQKQKKREFDWSKHNQRFIALRFAYLGWNYNGLAYQYEPTALPTVEETLLEALSKSKLIKEPSLECCKFSRCGRTDKGVSAMNQVISLNVRSNLSPEQQQDANNDKDELNYMRILNSLLPMDIRVTAVCLRPPEKFDARFSCKYRHYRYIFQKRDLDIEIMDQAARLYEGVHDFRNFCKIDGSKQITNYVRDIHHSRIIHLKDDYYCFDLKGSAFLWHQVRCMVAILFLVAQKLESISIIEDLTNVEKFPRKPVYEMANEVPLVLYDCEYEEMEWIKYNKDAGRSFSLLFNKFPNLTYDTQIKSEMTKIMEHFVLEDVKPPIATLEGGRMHLGDGLGRNYTQYVPLSERHLNDTFEVINERHKEKKRRAKSATTEQSPE
ncbi:DEG1 [[Candida] subhashii]|uniref:DEG1 n=1 Tax=[Candida] subhashii TaxID=561895 RepID=A0A8J5UNB4_9ASCO|nr:DEG1 [[Candida] subhashii]KAG7663557.1 DEG1 [[Candida] subhashii]